MSGPTRAVPWTLQPGLTRRDISARCSVAAPTSARWTKPRSIPALAARRASLCARRLRKRGFPGCPVNASIAIATSAISRHTSSKATRWSAKASGSGVVTAIVASAIRGHVHGQQNHAGTTSMRSRKDAGLALAKLCVAIDEAFPKACGPRTVWTTGRITHDRARPASFLAALPCFSRCATPIPP